jgi:hypothetical protein
MKILVYFEHSRKRDSTHLSPELSLSPGTLHFMPIDCSDSRVSEQEISSAQPTRVFVHCRQHSQQIRRINDLHVPLLAAICDLKELSRCAFGTATEITAMQSPLLLWNLSRSDISLFSVTLGPTVSQPLRYRDAEVTAVQKLNLPLDISTRRLPGNFFFGFWPF